MTELQLQKALTLDFHLQRRDGQGLSKTRTSWAVVSLKEQQQRRLLILYVVFP
jgi:hypothetical protein